MPRKKLNQGQQWMPAVQESVEQSFEDRPKGMPSLAMIKTETTKLELPDSDADALYDAWLACGFKTGRGRLIVNWRAALRTWFHNRWFPSQKFGSRRPSRQQTEEAQLQKIRKMRDGQNPA